MYLHIFWSTSWVTGERHKCLPVNPRTAPGRALGSLKTWIKTAAGSHILKEKTFSLLVPPLLQPGSVTMLLLFLQFFEISLQRFQRVS